MSRRNSEEVLSDPGKYLSVSEDNSGKSDDEENLFIQKQDREDGDVDPVEEVAAEEKENNENNTNDDERMRKIKELYERQQELLEDARVRKIVESEKQAILKQARLMQSSEMNKLIQELEEKPGETAPLINLIAGTTGKPEKPPTPSSLFGEFATTEEKTPEREKIRYKSAGVKKPPPSTGSNKSSVSTTKKVSDPVEKKETTSRRITENSTTEPTVEIIEREVEIVSGKPRSISNNTAGGSAGILLKGLGSKVVIAKDLKDIEYTVAALNRSFKPDLETMVNKSPTLFNQTLKVCHLYQFAGLTRVAKRAPNKEMLKKWTKALSEQKNAKGGLLITSGVFKGLKTAGNLVHFQNEFVKLSANFYTRSLVFELLLDDAMIINYGYSHALSPMREEELVVKYTTDSLYKDSRPVQRFVQESSEWLPFVQNMSDFLYIEMYLWGFNDIDIVQITKEGKSWNLMSVLRMDRVEVYKTLSTYDSNKMKYYRKKALWSSLTISQAVKILSDNLLIAKGAIEAELKSHSRLSETNRELLRERCSGKTLEQLKAVDKKHWIHIAQVYPLWNFTLAYDFKISKDSLLYERACKSLGLFKINKDEITFKSLDEIKSHTKDLNQKLRDIRSKLGYNQKGRGVKTDFKSSTLSKTEFDKILNF